MERKLFRGKCVSYRKGPDGHPAVTAGSLGRLVSFRWSVCETGEKKKDLYMFNSMCPILSCQCKAAAVTEEPEVFMLSINWSWEVDEQ